MINPRINTPSWKKTQDRSTARKLRYGRRFWSDALVLVVMVVGTTHAKTQQEPAHWDNLSNMPVGVFGAAVSRSGPLVVVTGGITQLGAASHWVQVNGRPPAPLKEEPRDSGLPRRR